MADQPADSRATWKPAYNPYIIALTVTLATFMEVLDSSIANVSLPHIGGSLGATYEGRPGFSPATWSPPPSYCRSPVGCRPCWAASAST